MLDVVNAFSKACGKPVNYHFAPRREGDLRRTGRTPAKPTVN
ncbi:hypothetical protein ACLB1E_28345 [Escherichia coli]